MPDHAVPADVAETLPEILAPAGDTPSFLAALAAGARAAPSTTRVSRAWA